MAGARPPTTSTSPSLSPSLSPGGQKDTELEHWAGFPSGWLGMAMAAGWGLALGVIRVRTGGILASYVVHVCVNATMGTLALVLLR